MKLIDKLIGTYSQREIKKLKKTVDLIESKEEEFRAKTDDELAAITPLLKERYQNGETLDDLLPDGSPPSGKRRTARSANDPSGYS